MYVIFTEGMSKPITSLYPQEVKFGKKLHLAHAMYILYDIYVSNVLHIVIVRFQYATFTYLVTKHSICWTTSITNPMIHNILFKSSGFILSNDVTMYPIIQSYMNCIQLFIIPFNKKSRGHSFPISVRSNKLILHSIK